MAMQRPVLSIVMPAKNEEGNLQRAYQELGAVLDALGEPYEVLIIDNASTDGTRRIVRELCDRDQRWRYLRFSRDFGVETSMAVGLRSARGDAAMVVFSDLQDPVALCATARATHGGNRWGPRFFTNCWSEWATAGCLRKQPISGCCRVGPSTPWAC
jgi:hypothetical protein